MTNQIEKSKKLQENISAEDLKKQIAEGKLSDLEDRVPELIPHKALESDNPNNLDNINKNNNLTPDKTKEELADIYINTLENQENHPNYSQNPDDKQKKIWNEVENMYNTKNWFVSEEEAAKIKQIADINRQKSNDKLMNMLPEWLQKLVK